MPNGRSLTGQSHDYKRHGTTTLFAALNVATGKVIGSLQAAQADRIPRFMNEIGAAFVLDNLSTHKPKRDMLLAHHKNVTFHCTPTHTSWRLNQVEIWFSILTAKSLKGASFQAVEELRIDDETARPFAWTKPKVHQKYLKPCFTD
jgi:hypothetical protein